MILEGEAHSIWVNSRLLARHGITDDIVDPVPGLSYYVRKDGHVTGNIFEAAAETRFLIDGAENLTDEQINAFITHIKTHYDIEWHKQMNKYDFCKFYK